MQSVPGEEAMSWTKSLMLKHHQVNKAAEADATKTMIDRVDERYDIKPERLAGGTNNGSAAMLGWLVDEKQVEPHIPVFDKSGRKDGAFSRSDFQWDEQANEYRCPEGHPLCSDCRPFKNPRERITKVESSYNLNCPRAFTGS